MPRVGQSDFLKAISTFVVHDYLSGCQVHNCILLSCFKQLFVTLLRFLELKLFEICSACDLKEPRSWRFFFFRWVSLLAIFEKKWL